MKPHEIAYVVIRVRPSAEATPVLERALPAPRKPGWVLTTAFVSLAMIGLGTVFALVWRAVAHFLSQAVPW